MEHDHFRIPTLIIRHGIPNKFDHAPFGTHCKVIHSDGYFELYQQMSIDESAPRWERIDWEKK